MTAALLRATGLSKRFGAVQALDEAHLEISDGSVMGLVGKNGAGKSTLIKIITGVYPADAGRLSFAGEDMSGSSAREATERGIVSVPQESSLWPTLSVGENILLPDLFRSQAGWVSWRQSRRVAKDAMRRVGLDVSLDRRTDSLGVPEQRRLMMARALARNPRLLILDEPTEAFTESEVSALFKTLNTLVAGGMSLLYVSHRLDEVLRISDAVTVISDGRNVFTGVKADIDRQALTRAIVGERQLQMEETAPQNPVSVSDAPSALELIGLVSRTLRGVNIALRPGEIVGLYGLAGAGRSDLLHCIAGSRPITSGRITAGGKDLTSLSMQRRRRAGFFLLGEDRSLHGLLPSLTVRENTVLGANYTRSRVAGLRRRETQAALAALAKVNYARTDLETPVSALSGGNKQKVLFARGLVCHARLWLLDEPTVGLDVAARAELFATLRGVVRERPDAAALVAMSDFDDLRAGTDRVLVLRDGRIVADVPTGSLTEAGLLQLASFGTHGSADTFPGAAPTVTATSRGG